MSPILERGSAGLRTTSWSVSVLLKSHGEEPTVALVRACVVRLIARQTLNGGGERIDFFDDVLQ
ncbi:MAG: hypothetical protein ACLQHS_07310, partial [Candidatus Limnocylindrales bacterium]